MISRRKLIRIAAPAIIGIAAAPKLARAMQLPFDGWGNSLGFPSGRTAGFNPLHPMSKGISGIHGFSAIFQGGTFINLVTGVPFTVFSAFTATPTQSQMGPVGKSTASPSQVTITGAAVADNNLTLAMIFETPTPATTAPFIKTTNVGTNQGWQLGTFNVNNGLTVEAFAGTQYALSPTLTLTANVPYFGAFSVAGGGATFNGVLLNLITGALLSGSGTSGSPTTTTASAGTYVIGGGFANTYIAAGMFAPFTASLSQLIQWAQAPWDFWYPPDMLMAELKGTVAAAGTSHFLPLLGVGR